MAQTKGKPEITMTHLLVPMAMMAFTLTLLFSFQMTQIMRDREALHMTIQQQDAPLQEAQKLNAQFGGLVVGTRKLADQGSKGAQALVEQLKQIGVIPQQPSQTVQGTPAPIPAAMERPSDAPVKP